MQPWWYHVLMSETTPVTIRWDAAVWDAVTRCAADHRPSVSKNGLVNVIVGDALKRRGYLPIADSLTDNTDDNLGGTAGTSV